MCFCCKSRGNYYLPSCENVCPVKCTMISTFLLNLLCISLTTTYGLLLVYPTFGALMFCTQSNNCFVDVIYYIYYNIGMMSEISFARFSCIIFLAASTSSLFASAHIALTVAVSEIISDRDITPISSKSLPVS